MLCSSVNASLNNLAAVATFTALEPRPLLLISLLLRLSFKAEVEYKSLHCCSLPRKSPPFYAKIHTHIDSFVMMQANNNCAMQNEEQSIPAKRPWRFYGAFATLALLNLICAINVTVLLVALPVSDSSNSHYAIC